MKFIDKLFKKNKDTNDGKRKYLIDFDTPSNNINEFFSSANSRYLTEQYKNLVYSCVNLRAENIAKAVPIIYKKANQTDKDEPDNHPILKVLNRPGQRFSRYKMLYEYSKNLDLYGNCFFEVVRYNNGEIAELVLLPPYKECWEIRKKDGEITEYILTINQKKHVYSVEDIIHCKNAGKKPDSDFGMSVIEAGIDTFQLENAVNTHHKRYFENGAVPSLIISPESDIMSQLEAKRFEEDIINKHSGVDNHGKILYSTIGLKVETLSNTPAEINYPETWKMIQTRILSIFRINPALLGIVEDVNRANDVAADRKFFTALDTILKKLDNDINLFLWNEYAGTDNYYVEYKISQPTDRDYELKKHEADCRWGYITINEARAFNGYGKIEGGDILLEAKPDMFVQPDKPDPGNPEN